MLPLLAVSAPNVWVTTDGLWWFAKNKRTRAKTSIPRISVPTPMLFRVATSRTPKAFKAVVRTSVVKAMKVNMSAHAERGRAGEEVLLGHDPVDDEGHDAGDGGDRARPAPRNRTSP